MTPIGHAGLKAELERLTKVERPTVITAIAEARAHGDLKENAEYHAAKEKQGFIEGRIKEVEGKLANAQVINVKDIPHTGKVIFGTTVELLNVEDESIVKYQLVGEDEADHTVGKISIGSPIAKALVGKSEGDVVEVRIPSGVVSYEIVEVVH
jgi:transcription elongation factor GreA